MKVCIILLSLYLLAPQFGVNSHAVPDTYPLFEGKDLRTTLLEFIRPYQITIRKWFWEISGVAYTNPFGVPSDDIGTQADYLNCDVCVQALPLVKSLLKAGVTKSVIIGVLTAACIQFELAPKPDICGPTIVSYATSVLYIVENTPTMVDDDFCGIINPGCRNISDHLSNWNITVSSDQAPRPSKPSLPLPTDKLSKIIHFTDVHLDLDYDIGANTDCGLPICCRTDFGMPDTENNAAKKYGDFKCALPEVTLKAMYNHAKVTHGEDTKMIFLTGDYIHSAVWLYGVEENRRHLSSVTTWLKETFEGTGVEIYPLVGNHEPDVVNMFPSGKAMNEFPLTWMYDAVMDPFQGLLPPDQLNQFRAFGYYSVLSNHDPKLRLVVLNTNLCYTNNFWLPYDAVDTFGQLKWFSSVMSLTEKLGQKVFILGHIHPGSGSCWPVWSRQFNKIIQRYAYMIRGQFYGHSHEQNYKLTLEDGTGRPIGVSYVGGSTLTDGMNPAYNVYHVDGERGSASTWEIINHESWIVNLTASNLNPDEDPRFERILNANTDYQLQSMHPEDVHSFITSVVCKDDLFQKYQRVSYKGEDSPRMKLCGDDKDCKAGVLGNLFVSNSADRSHREAFEQYVLTHDCSGVDESGSSSLKYNMGFLFMALISCIVFRL